MTRLKIIDLLKTLDKTEFKEFGKFLKSPIFNSNSNSIKLYSCISKYFPHFDENKLTSAKIHKKIFKNKRYNEKVLQNLSAEMTHQLVEFMTLLEQRKQTRVQNRLLLKQLFDRRLFKLFEKYLNNAFENLETQKIKDEDYYLNKYFLEMIKVDYLNICTPFNQLTKHFHLYSQGTDNLIYYFIVLMLKEYLHIHNRRTNFNFAEDFKFIDEIRGYLSKNTEILNSEKLINLFSKFLKMYDEPYNESILSELKLMLLENKPYVKKEIYTSLIVDLYNYCMHQEELGREKYQRESFELMNEMLKDNLPLGEDGYLSGYAYKSIAINALKLDETVWFNEFVYNYKNKVRVEERENSFRFCQGCYYNKLGNESRAGSTKREEMYRLALENLSHIKPNDFTFMTILKNIQINIYYELGEFDNAFSVIASYRQYLASNRLIPENIVLRASNFIKTIDKLIKIKLGSRTNSIEQLKNEVASYKTIYSRNELLTKIDELEKELEQRPLTV